MPMGPNMSKLQLTLDNRVRLRVERLADEAGLTKSSFITMLINNAWKEANHTDDEDGVLIV